uniref:E3 ubiquitin/ISG15 ligase TRIM25-like n=1 Tax=Oryzias melastigma TaxID=30732 RepID=A0A3B3DMX8_ORYME
MAAALLDQVYLKEKLICSICLDLQKDPVTIPCGHSYCLECIENFWGEEQKALSCPQCRQSFTSRPVLVRNTILAELVEDARKAELQPSSSERSPTGPEHVDCDFCEGKKLKAAMSCLTCLASYCEQHLQPHFRVAGLKKHKLVKATLKLQENICPRHDEVIKIFCRTDQKCICILCSMDEHKGHDMVSAAAERAERQTKLGLDRQKVQERILKLEEDLEELQQTVETINLSAEKSIKESQNVFKGLIRLLEQKCSEVEQKVKSYQMEEVRKVEELQEKMQQEITKLRKTEAELDQLSSTEDHLHFLNNYSSLSDLSVCTDLASFQQAQHCFDDALKAVSEATEKLEETLRDQTTKISHTLDVILFEDFRSREDFMKYYHQITLDPNTANTLISLSEQNRTATLTLVRQKCSNHPDRFDEWIQVLSAEGLTGRCYWEVEWSGEVDVSVAYKDISRTGTRDECGFGCNDKSWALMCSSTGYQFYHNKISVSISAPQSSRVGVYLNHRAGTLSFYSVSDSMTLIHKVQTTFTQPLYAGFWICFGGMIRLLD